MRKDYPLCKHPDNDGLEQKLRDLIKGNFDPQPLGLVDIAFISTSTGDVRRIEIRPSDQVIHYGKAVYRRDGNRTIQLEGRQLTDWLLERARK